MLDPSIIHAMVASGCSAATLAAAVIADQQADHEKLLEQRTKWRIAKRNQRSCLLDNEGQSETPLPPSPPLDKEKVSTPLKEINPPLTPQPHVLSAREIEFELFWQGNKHKVGIAAAKKAFVKARQRAPFEEIMDGLGRYIRDKPPDRPWCNPSTWLNQDRWKDQPADNQLSAKPLSPRLSVILNNRRMFDEAARAADNCFEAPELRPLGGPTPEIIPANRNTGNGRIY